MLRPALLFGVLLACVAHSFALFNTKPGIGFGPGFALRRPGFDLGPRFAWRRPGFAWKPASWLDNKLFVSFVESAGRFGEILAERNAAFSRKYGEDNRYTDYQLFFRLRDGRRCESVVTWDDQSVTGGITKIIGGCSNPRRDRLDSYVGDRRVQY